MKLVYMKDCFEGVSKKTNERKTFYVIRPCLVEGDVIIVKGQPILWLTQEQFDKYTK